MIFKGALIDISFKKPLAHYNKCTDKGECKNAQTYNLKLHAMNTPTNKTSFDLMQVFLALGMVIYISFYAFESPIRYVLNMVGLDPLIFIRDAVIVSLVGVVFMQQLFKKQVAPYFFIYAFIIGFHGIVIILNTGSIMAVAYSAKMYISMLFGAIAAFAIFKPNGKMLLFFLFLWVTSVIFIFLNKYFLEFPWTDMTTKLMGVEVEVSRDWTLTGAAKRAAGLYRASINAGMLVPLLSLVLVFHTRNIILRALILIITIYTLYLTTMKGALLSFVILSILILGAVAVKFVTSARIWLIFAIILMILFPIVLPGYYMPDAEGQFSLGSFNLRVEHMWPEGWQWIKDKETFPFGVGLGGISGAQRLYAPTRVTAADNMYLFMYANFGILTFAYIGWFVFMLTMARAKIADKHLELSVAVLTFVIAYGIVLSMLEDQMANLFMGAGLSWFVQSVLKQHREEEGQNGEDGDQLSRSTVIEDAENGKPNELG